ncbi:amino acid transporter AVT1J-like [Penaeus japonicus]|uniref:amino acid transporter AVT1J-like n=1 Tax=Penaeus japonicus TaxID=27405 RepID=UPI001C711CBB|nr:amino acid transporter AVT1J-like [Penaeus japonicus]
MKKLCGTVVYNITNPAPAQSHDSPLPQATEKTGRCLSVPLAAAFLVAEMSGSGVLALPKAIANTGWAGLPLMVLLCACVGFAGTRLAICWVLLEDKWPEYRQPCRRPYPAIAYRAFGTVGSLICTAAQQATLLGVSTVFLLLAAQLLSALAQPLLSSATLCSCLFVVGGVLVPATWLGTPKDFWPASVAAVIVTVLACTVVVVEVARSPVPPADPPVYGSPTFTSFFLGFGTIVFSLGGAATFPTVQNDMKERSKFVYSVAIAFTVLLVLYMPVSGVGYGVLGQAVSDNILLSVSGTAVTATRAMIFSHLLFVFVIIFNPVAQGLEEALAVPREFGWQRCCVRTLLLALIVLMAVSVPDFGKILNLIGGSSVTIESFVLPPLCYLKLCSTKDDQGKPYRSVGFAESAVLISVVITGVCAGVITTYTAASAIATPGSLGQSCFSSEAYEIDKSIT